MSADPFSAVIRYTCDGKADNKTISKWSRALRYVARVKKPRHPLTTFMKNRGGVNGCAALFAENWGGVADENTRFCKVYLIDLSYVKL
jgi:hypothetical protein